MPHINKKNSSVSEWFTAYTAEQITKAERSAVKNGFVKTKRRVFMLTPIPPQATGTAAYASFLLRDIKSQFANLDLFVVVDDRMFVGEIPKQLMGFPVIPYSLMMPHVDDVLIVFVANNIFHRHALEELVKARSKNIYTFIHDPQIFMIIAHLCNLRKSVFSPEIFTKSLGSQFGNFSPRITEWLEGQSIPSIGHFLIGCQGITIENSKMLIVHSYYAALKLQLEYVSKKPTPRILVMQHPEADATPEEDHAKFPNEDRETCVFGLFGWISKSKRPKLIFLAFERFLTGLNPAARGGVRLRVVGQIVPEDFDVPEEVEKHPYKDQIEYYDYVPKEQFEELMSECSLVINLRFPSCGETSGTLAHAATYGISTVTSNYQGFFEEDSTYKISIDPETEVEELVRVFEDVYRKQPPFKPLRDPISRIRPKLNARAVFDIIQKDFEAQGAVK